MPSITTPFLLAERFWEKVKKTDTCWNWIGATRLSNGMKRNRGNYGIMRINDKVYSAPRISWELHNGPIRSTGLWVLHHCDNPSCVRPDHLWLGTHQDNVDDKVKKGRSWKPEGEKAPWHILTKEQVVKMRSLYDSGEKKIFEIAKIFNIKSPTVGAVVRRTTWKHII
jgi:hypothetical protein